MESQFIDEGTDGTHSVVFAETAGRPSYHASVVSEAPHLLCRRFVILYRELKLFTHAIVAIDRSKFKAVSSRDRSFSLGEIDGRQKQIEQSIQRYLDALETADGTQPPEVEAKPERCRTRSRSCAKLKQLDDTKEQLKKESASGGVRSARTFLAAQGSPRSVSQALDLNAGFELPVWAFIGKLAAQG